MTNHWSIRITELKGDRLFSIALMVVAILGGILVFPLSFLSQTNLLIGIVLIPYVIRVESASRFNHFYCLLFFLFEVAAAIYGLRMFYFFALAFYVLWLVEIFFGKVTKLVLFLLVFMSPFFSQVSGILGFPIRLQLSQWAGDLLRMIHLQVQTEGNLILLNGAAFSVDDACVGLNMFAISMLMGIFLIAHHSRVSQKSMKFYHQLFFFVICFGLNIVANLFRIVLLVIFKIEPGDAMHEIIGLLCLAIYVMLPLYLLAGQFLKRWGYECDNGTRAFPISRSVRVAVISAALSILLAGIRVPQVKAAHSAGYSATVNFPGFTCSQAAGDVTKLVNDELLIYVKPIPEFFTGEHSPLFCWKGSGYEFKSITKNKLGEIEIYTGKLTKGNSQLFTAWWYSNNDIQTISQLDWRWRMLRGEEKFSLINVTASDEQQLLKNIQLILHSRDFKIEYKSM